jgi:hypothetical protein
LGYKSPEDIAEEERYNWANGVCFCAFCGQPMGMCHCKRKHDDDDINSDLLPPQVISLPDDWYGLDKTEQNSVYLYNKHGIVYERIPVITRGQRFKYTQKRRLSRALPDVRYGFVENYIDTTTRVLEATQRIPTWLLVNLDRAELDYIRKPIIPTTSEEDSLAELDIPDILEEALIFGLAKRLDKKDYVNAQDYLDTNTEYLRCVNEAKILDRANTDPDEYYQTEYNYLQGVY